MLAQMGSGDAPATDIDRLWRPPGLVENALAHRHEFRQFSSFSAVELRKLRVRHEEFVRSLAARLSIYLRLEVGLQMTKLETMPFQKFVESLSNPTHLTSIRLNPLEGVSLLDIPPRFGLCIVDRELGGPGVCLEDPRELSEIEARLLSEVVTLMINEWCGSWSDMLDLSPVLLGHENNGRFIQASPGEDMLLVLGMEARIGEILEQIHFAFPYPVLEPLMSKLNAGTETGHVSKAARPAAQKWNPALQNVRIPLTAELPNMELTARQLAQLKPGDVLELTSEMAGQVRLCLGPVPKFAGVLGMCGQHCAVKITGMLKS